MMTHKEVEWCVCLCVSHLITPLLDALLLLLLLSQQRIAVTLRADLICTLVWLSPSCTPEGSPAAAPHGGSLCGDASSSEWQPVEHDPTKHSACGQLATRDLFNSLFATNIQNK